MAKKTTFNIDKKENFSEWYSEILQKAEICDMRYGVKGFVVIQPWGARIMEKMYKLFESALMSTGHEPSFFPTVIPEENFRKEAGHVKGFDPQVFWLENKQGEDRVALRPTSETAFYEMYNLWIRSYRDLPFKMYQRASVFRCETKATRPLIRGREFWWCEAHDCFATKKEAEAQVLDDVGITRSVMYELLGVPFLAMKRPEWDKFPGADYTVGSDTVMPDGKIIQQPSTHMLGQHFSKGFDVKFVDEKEKDQYVWQTCYGPAISRILASVISMHGDDGGLVLPYVVSPFQVVIVPMFNEEKKKEISDLAFKLKNDFFKEHVDAIVDESDKRPGEKFFHWEMKGVPFRVELGARELEAGEVTVFVRDTKEKVSLKLENLVEDIKNMGVEFDLRLKNKADLFFEQRVVDCKDMKEIKKALKDIKIARFSFCSVDEDGEKCAGILEKDFGAEVRGTVIDEKEKASGKCPFCDKKAKVVVYAGKSY